MNLLPTEGRAARLETIISDLLGRRVISVDCVGTGRNNRVYKIACDGMGPLAAKIYLRQSKDDRNRLEIEFGVLSFLWEHGVRCIPQPLAVDENRGCAVYEYIEGQVIPSHQVSPSDIHAVVLFLRNLKDLCSLGESSTIPEASEASFSAQAVLRHINGRMARLETAAGDHPDLKSFLDLEFAPCREAAVSWCRTVFEQRGFLWEQEIGPEERTLSPSDLGFHNALKCPDGRIVFLDFEYFGWDDPAKMICDFLLHPGMDLNAGLKRLFCTTLLESFASNWRLEVRVQCLYPLFGLNWCLRLLNEFLPEQLERRLFAQGQRLQKEIVQRQQMAKARRMLTQVKDEYRKFPYTV